MPYRRRNFARGHVARGRFGGRFGRNAGRNGRFRKGKSHIRGRVITFMNPAKNPVPMPQAYFCKHPFAIIQNTDQTATVFTLNTYTPCDLFNVSGTSDAAWALQMSTMYDTYCVYGYKWTLKAANLDSISGMIAGVCPWPSPDAPTTMTDIAVRTGGTYKQLATGTDTRSVVSQTGYVSVPKLLGIPYKQYLNEPENWGTALAGPTKNPPLYVWFQNQAALLKIRNNTCVTITMYVKWFDRKNLSDPNPPGIGPEPDPGGNGGGGGGGEPPPEETPTPSPEAMELVDVDDVKVPDPEPTPELVLPLIEMSDLF